MLPLRHASFLVAIILIYLSRIGDLAAHEFWIEPVDFTPSEGAKIVANLKNGENHKGNSLPFLTSQFEQFTLEDAFGSTAIDSRLGDVPAVSLIAQLPGFAVLAYESKAKTLRYEKFSKFESFVTKEGIEWVLDEHKREKLPTAHIAEVYFRYAKSLLLVSADTDAGGGSVEPRQDKYLGMPLELVMLDNPYFKKKFTKTVTKESSVKNVNVDAEEIVPMQIQVLFEGKPLENAQISIFEKSNGLIDRRRTDERGVLVWNFESGSYLLNAVHAIRPSKELVTQTGALWQTLWASTTFLVP